jgi:hypothetical protein
LGVGKPGVWCQHVFAIQISRIPATGFVSLLDSAPTIAAHLMVVNQFTRPGRATCIYQVSPRQFWLFSVGFLLQIPHSPKGRPKKKSPPQRCNCRPSAALAALAAAPRTEPLRLGLGGLGPLAPSPWTDELTVS